jgi:hypothetical protein
MMLDNLRWKLSIWWGEILAKQWKRKRRTRYQGMVGQDD